MFGFLNKKVTYKGMLAESLILLLALLSLWFLFDLAKASFTFNGVCTQIAVSGDQTNYPCGYNEYVMQTMSHWKTVLTVVGIGALILALLLTFKNFFKKQQENL